LSQHFHRTHYITRLCSPHPPRTLAGACQLPKLPIRSRAVPHHPLLVPQPNVRPPCLPAPAARSPPPRTPPPRLRAPHRPASTSPLPALCHARPVPPPPAPPPPAPTSRTCLRVGTRVPPRVDRAAVPSPARRLRRRKSTCIPYASISLARSAFPSPPHRLPTRPRVGTPMRRCNSLPYASLCPVTALRWRPLRCSTVSAPRAAPTRPAHLDVCAHAPASSAGVLPARRQSSTPILPLPPTPFRAAAACHLARFPHRPRFALLRLPPLLRRTLLRPRPTSSALRRPQFLVHPPCTACHVSRTPVHDVSTARHRTTHVYLHAPRSPPRDPSPSRHPRPSRTPHLRNRPCRANGVPTLSRGGCTLSCPSWTILCTPSF
jgi:hypothetical protein